MIRWFLRFLEAHGRKLVVADPSGNVLAYRYCLLYAELPDSASIWPNIYIHHFVSQMGIDGPGEHHHPWRTYGVILKGWYTENFKGEPRVRKPGAIHWFGTGDSHGIVSVQENTWTLFAHGFRAGEWLMKFKACQDLCQTCKGEFGRCLKGVRPFTHSDLFDDVGSSKWRMPTWEVVTPEVMKRIARRKRAAAKVGMFVPASMDDLLESGFRESRAFKLVEHELRGQAL